MSTRWTAFLARRPEPAALVAGDAATITDANAAFARCLGAVREALLDRPLATLAIGEQQSALRAFLAGDGAPARAAFRFSTGGSDTAALTLELIELAGDERLLLASAGDAGIDAAPAPEAAWLRETLAVAADWLWTIDRDLAAIAMVPTRDRAEQPEQPHCVFDLPGQFAELPDESGTQPDVASILLQRLPFRRRVLGQTLADGRHRFIQLSGLPIHDRAGGFCGYRGIAIDVTAEIEAATAQKTLAEAVSRQLDWVRQAIDKVGHSIVIFDRDTRLVTCNKHYRDTYRAGDRSLPPDIVLEGKTYRELMELRVKYKLHKEFADEPEKFVEDRMRRFETDSDQTTQLSTGIIINSQYRRLPDGVRVHIGSDITQIVVGEKNRQKLEAQLHHLHSQKLEALGTLAGGVAHELNNALVPIMALTKITARRLPPGSRERSNLDTVGRATERTRDLVRQILTFSRKDAMPQQLFDLGAVVREAMGMLRAIVPSTIKIDVALAPVPMLLGDPGQWHQVLVNLVSNAAKAIGTAHGRIAVALAPAVDEIELAVADTGCGMDEATRGRIFEPFFTTRDVGEGTGLGLSVVHGIVASHGGRINVDSAPDTGTRFTIRIPAAPAESPAMAAAAAKAAMTA